MSMGIGIGLGIGMGTRPPAAPPPPPALVTIVSVTVTAPDTVVIEFDGDPGYNGANAGPEFTVALGGFQLTSAPDSTHVQLVQPFGQPPIAAGDPWDLSGQPPWADRTIVQPASGITV